MCRAAIDPAAADGEPNRTAEAAHSRALLSHASRGLDHEFDLAFLEQIDRFTAIQPIIWLCQEVQDRPRIIGRECLANGLEAFDDGAVRQAIDEAGYEVAA